MKRRLSLLLALIFCFVGLLGNAEAKVLVNEADRKIVGTGRNADGSYNDNPIIDGISPTTGREWSGYYQPMLVQIDNTDGGTGVRSPWGAHDADIIYESPLHKIGATRMSFLFSDNVPFSAGPVRSARVGHCWLREEWEAGFCFYGSQELEGSSCNAVFRETGADKKGVIFSGIVGAGKPWARYYNRIHSLVAPHNVDVNVAAIRDLIPKSHVAIPHPFLFKDDKDYDGEDVTHIAIDVNHELYDSEFEYNADENCYYRKVNGEPFTNRDFETGEMTDVTVQNLIIQRTHVGWNNGNSLAPITEHVGKGNADIFIAGKYIAGYWERPDYKSRTVYMDADGNEIKLQRGVTYIFVTQYETPVTID